MSVQEVYNYSNTQEVIVAMAPSSPQLTRHSETNFKPKPIRVLLHGHPQHNPCSSMWMCTCIRVCACMCVHNYVHCMCGNMNHYA